MIRTLHIQANATRGFKGANTLLFSYLLVVLVLTLLPATQVRADAALDDAVVGTIDISTIPGIEADDSPIPGTEMKDEALGKHYARGAEKFQLEIDDGIAVILWDEAGRSNNPPAALHESNGAGNIQRSSVTLNGTAR